MGNDISTNNYSSAQNELINDIKNTLNADTETFKPNKQSGGIVWNPRDIFVTHEGLRGEVIKKRTEPHLVHKKLYEVRVNDKIETMWPESNMMEPSEVKAKRDAEVHKYKLKEEQHNKRLTNVHSTELVQKRELESRQNKLTELLNKIKVEEQKIKTLQASKQPETVKTSERQRVTSNIQGLNQELRLVNQQIAALEK